MDNVEHLRSLGVLWDDEDDHIVRAGTWGVSTMRNVKYVQGGIKGTKRRTSLHRAIMRPPKGMVVDHINGNGLDNRRANLRVVTNAQNCRHRVREQRNNTSGQRGVFYNKRVRRWLVKFMVDGKYHYLGWHKTAEEAAVVARDFLERASNSA